MRGLSILSSPLLLLLASTAALANQQPPVLYDARSAGMGGTGVAYLDSVAGAFHNPANLQGVKQLSLTVAFSPYFSVLTTPWPNPANGTIVQLSTPTTLSPLPDIGVAYRINDRLVVGVNALLLAGAGANYSKVPTFGGKDISAAAYGGEVAIPVSFKVNEILDIGAAYRVTYAQQQADIFAPAGPLAIRQKGANFAGVQVGVNLHPSDDLRFGLNWRSQVKTQMNGTTTVAGVSMDSNDHFIQPNFLSAGAAWTGLDKKLMVTGEYKYWMYAAARDNVATIQNAYQAAGGVEYKVAEQIPVRIGYFYGNASTTDQGASNFLTPPSAIKGPTLGAGYHTDSLDIDLAGTYSSSAKTTTAVSSNNGYPGEYKLTSLGIFASLTYKS